MDNVVIEEKRNKLNLEIRKILAIIDMIDGNKKEYEDYETNSLNEIGFLDQQLKLVKEDVVKNEIVIRPTKLEGIEIKDYIKDKPVDLNSFNYTNV